MERAETAERARPDTGVNTGGQTAKWSPVCRATKGRRKEKALGEKRIFVIFLLYLGKKRICHLAKKAKYDVFYSSYLTPWNSLSRVLLIPQISHIYLLLKLKAKNLLWVGYIYLPFPSLEANITSKIPWHISLLPEVSFLICPSPYNRTPFHTWANLENHCGNHVNQFSEHQVIVP